jgi:hypothetical protein
MKQRKEKYLNQERAKRRLAGEIQEEINGSSSSSAATAANAPLPSSLTHSSISLYHLGLKCVCHIYGME